MNPVPTPDMAAMVAAGNAAALRPWPRAVVDVLVWEEALDQLRRGAWSLVGFWGDAEEASIAVADTARAEIAVFTLDCPDGRYPSVGAAHPPAIRLERAVRDLWGLEPVGAPDPRPWLDHGRWPKVHPLGEAGEGPAAGSYAFLPVEGEGLHQIPVGPVHAGVIEPGHFRFTASGETVVRLEERLGYTHRGLEGRMIGADPALGGRLAGRATGDSTVAYAVAFARAVEWAIGVEVPIRAHWLRALMAELERLANHLGDIGAVCNDAAFSLMHAHCGVLREQVLRAASAAFGHRLMMDRVTPGGVAADIAAEGIAAIRALMQAVRGRFPALVRLYDDTASLQDRTVGAGVVSPALARSYGAGGFVGRATGRAFDARRDLVYPPYGELEFDVPVRTEGDVNARVWIRIDEVEQSLRLIDQILTGLPTGAVQVELPARAGEGMALVEGFRGDILAWVRLRHDGRIDRCCLRDPSWFQWPLLEACIEGNIVADFPLCNKSFNCSYAGVDL
jgi:Ni,Fe-hydrogenase III large subunit